MASTQRIICLANSYKPDGRCIAGKHLVTGEWIRPIGLRASGSITPAECALAGGWEPELLELIDVPLRAPEPSPIQPENWVMDPSTAWRSRGSVPTSRLSSLVDTPAQLWMNGHSSLAGHNDRVPPHLAVDGWSIGLIAAHEVVVRVEATGSTYGDPSLKVRGIFEYAGTLYDVTVTDPVVRHTYLAMGEGRFPLGDRHLTVSLTEPYKGYAYKLIAAVFDE